MFFNSKIKTTLVFVSLVCFIYVLRGGDSSPMGFLARQASRILEERALTAKLCSGISMYETSTSEKNRAAKISSALKRIRSGNPLVDFIEGDDASSELAKEYAVPLVAYSAPWIVFFAIGLVGFLGCAINCCCMNFGFCGCLKCCQKPKTTRYLPVFKNSSFVLMTLLVGTSIAGLIFSQDVRIGGQQTVCALGILVDNLLEGVDGGNWLGLNPIIDNMTFLFDNNYITTNAVAVLASYLPVISAADKLSIETTYNAATIAVSSMQSTNSGKTATRPDSSAGSTYTPDYIADLSTHTTKIQTEMDNKETAMVDDGIDNIASGIIKINAVTYLTAIIQPYIMYQLDNAAGSAKNLSESMNDKGDIAKKGVKAVSGGLIGIFSVELIAALVAIGSIMLVRCGRQFFNKAIYGSCFCLTLLTILGFALSAFLFPTGVVLIEGCEVSEKLQTDPVFYNKVFDKFLSSDNYTQVRNILYNCLFEDGDVLTEIDIRKYFVGHQELFDGLESTYTLTEVNGVAITASTVIPQEQTLVSNYKTGLVSDASATTTDLKKLNKYTNSDSNSCTKIDDTWVLNSQLCTSSDGKVFASSDAANYNLYSATCLGFDSSSWGYGSSKKDITQRYTSTSFPQPSCGQIDGSNADSTLDSLVNGFATSRNDVNTIFGNVQTSLTSVASANTNFMSAINPFLATHSKYGICCKCLEFWKIESSHIWKAPQLKIILLVNWIIKFNDNIDLCHEKSANFWVKFETLERVKSANDNIDGTNGPRKTVAPVYAKLGDPKTGILPNGNCKWVKASLNTFQDVMCDRFITGVFQGTIVIIIASFFALFGSLMLFCLAKKILLDNKKDQEYAKARYATK